MKNLLPLIAVAALAVHAAAEVPEVTGRQITVPGMAPIQTGLVFEAKDGPAASLVGELTDKTFDDKVVKSKLPVFIDAYASWCGPCKFIAPAIEELAAKYKGKVTFLHFDIDAEPDLAKRLNITKMPTFVMYDKGAEAGRTIGVKSMQDRDASRDAIDADIQRILKVKP